MSDWQRMVRDFHEQFGVPVGDGPALRDAGLRASLIAEEAAETIEAIGNRDIVAAVDGLADLIYVALGAAVTWGVDLGPIFDEVHRTNMAKVGGRTRPDGKILKPEGWEPPRIRDLLLEQGERRVG